MSRRTCFLVAAAATATALATLAPGATAATLPIETAATPSVAGQPIEFDVPRLVDPFNVYNEPSVAVTPNGDVHVSGPQGTGVQRSQWNASVDGGDTYRIVQGLTRSDVQSQTGVVSEKATRGPGGGDTEFAVDRRTGQVFYSDLYALACFTAGTTKDRGTTVQSSAYGCSDPSADRQWQVVFDPEAGIKSSSPYKGPLPLAYLIYDGGTGQYGVTVSSSNDTTSAATGGVGTSYPTTAGGYDNTKKSKPVLDQQTGQMIAPIAATNNGISLAVGNPDASGNLTFHTTPAIKTLKSHAGVLFSSLAQDAKRNLYLAWIDQGNYQMYYAWAPVNAAGNDWTDWSAPVQVSSPPMGVATFSWAEAAGDGTLDLAWYGTDTTLATLGSSGPSAQKNQRWYLWFAQVTGAASSKPHIEQVVAAQHNNHINDICLSGTGCIAAQGVRNLGDFFELAIDDDGRARIVYNDTSNGLVQNVQGTSADGPADHHGAGTVQLVTQQTGVNARTGKPLTAKETKYSLGGVTDPAGDGLFPVLGGKPVDGGDILAASAVRTATGVRFQVVTKAAITGAATTARTPYALLGVRWQDGNTLRHVVYETDPSGLAGSFSAGKTQSIDLCSVSACKPNQLRYAPFPDPNAVSVPGTVVTDRNTTYTWDVPASAMGGLPAGSALDGVTAFVAVEPHSQLELNNAEVFAQEVPLLLDQTKPFNALGPVQPGKALVNPVTGQVIKKATAVKKATKKAASKKAAAPSGSLAATGLPLALPALAIAALALGLGLRRRKA